TPWPCAPPERYANTRNDPVGPPGVLPGRVEEAEAARARRRQPGEEAIPRHPSCSESRHVRRHDLDVEPVEPARTEVRNQVEERELRRVRLEIEHALRGECAVDVHAVDATDEAAAVPGLGAVSDPERVQVLVRLHDVRRDPGPVLPRPRCGGAAADDGTEIPV